MSLGVALTSVISSLNANQQALSIISTNIANANSENFTRREIVQSSQVVNGVASGVEIEDVRRAIDDFVVTSARRQVSNVGRYKVQSEFYDRLELFLGQPGSNNNINAQFDSFFARLAELANSPEQASLRTNTLESAISLTNNVSGLAQNIQQLRFDVDQAIDQQVTDINNLLVDLQNVNLALKNTGTVGGDKTALLDDRDAKLAELSEMINVDVTFSSDGQATVFLARTDLLSSASRFELSYTPVTSVDSIISGTPFGAIQVTLLNANGSPSGVPVTLSSASNAAVQEQYFSSGSLKGLLDMRDNELPNLLDQLDELTQTFADAFNAVHNDGTGFPPPSTLTGTRLLSPTEDHIYTGSVMIAVLGTDGAPLQDNFGTSGMPPLTLDFDTLTSTGVAGQVDLDAIVREINEYYGPPPAQKATLGPLDDIRVAAVSSSISSTAATGNILFTGNPGAGDTISINGTTFTYVAGAPVGNQIRIGVNLATTLQNTTTALNNSNVAAVAQATYSTVGTNTLLITHDVAGDSQNGVFGLDANFSISGGAAQANINGIGAAADPAASFLGVGTGTAGIDANGTFTFDFEMTNIAGSDATFEVLDIDYGAGLTGQSLGPFTSSSGLRQRTNLGGATGGEGITFNLATLPASVEEGGTFTISASVRVTDSNGVQSTDTITFTVTVPDPNDNIINKRYAATAAGDPNTLTAAANATRYATARIVDANGNPVAAGSSGYLQIVSNRSGTGIALDELDSQEGGTLANPSGTATGRGFSHYFGLNDFFTTGNSVAGSAVNFSVRDGYRTDPSRLATGELVRSNQLSDPDANPIYTYEVGLGSNQLVTRLGELKTSRQDFNSAGGLPAARLTFGNYASEILSFASLSNKRIDAALEQEQTLYSAFQERLDATGGINVDEELANTVLFQNNFNASARLITIISEMLDKMIESF